MTGRRLARGTAAYFAALAALIVAGVVVGVILSLVLATPAGAHRGDTHRWRTTTVTSTQEGCGPDGLTLSVRWRPVRDGVQLRSVFADGPDGYRHFLSVTTPDGVVSYAGPSGHDVGDHANYLWIRGRERTNDTGQRVPIGASDTNPAGWTTLTGTAFTVRAVVPEGRYCGAQVVIP